MKLLTPETVAESLSVSRSTVLRMIADGALPAICLRSGRRKKVWRIREEMLEKWILNREKKTRQTSEPLPSEVKSNGEANSALAHEANAQ